MGAIETARLTCATPYVGPTRATAVFAPSVGSGYIRPMVFRPPFRIAARLRSWPLLLALAWGTPLVPGPSAAAQTTGGTATARDAYNAGKALYARQQTEQAITQYHEAVVRGRRTADSVTLALAQYEIGYLYWERNQFDRALPFLDSARAVQVNLPNREQLGRVHNTTGAAYYHLGLYEPAVEAYRLAMTIRSETGDTLGMVRTLTNLGKSYQDWGQRARARSTFVQAIALAQRLPNGGGVLGYAFDSKAMLAIDERQYDEARQLIDSARAAYATAGTATSVRDAADRWEVVTTSVAALELRTGQLAQAVTRLDSVLTSATRRGNIRGQIHAQLLLGEAQAALGQTAVARQLLTDALALATASQQRVFALDALRQLTAIDEAAGAWQGSLRQLQRLVALRDTVFSQDVAVRFATRESREAEQRALRDRASLQADVRRQQTIGVLVGVIALLALCLVAVLVRSNRNEKARGAALASANTALTQALAEVRQLSGLIPICANCKKVRDDQGYWKAVEAYIAERSEATFTHSICRSCGPVLYGDLWED